MVVGVMLSGLALVWAAGLVGVLVGVEIADRRDTPTRQASSLAVTTGSPREDPYGPIDVAAVAGTIAASTVAIQVRGSEGISSGTGVIITADGEIVTNAHVVAGADSVAVRLPGESEPRPGVVTASDATNDLALVRIEADDLVPAVFADPTDVRIGDEVVAVGFALDLDGDPSVTRGIISALDRTLSIDEGVLNGLIQTDAAISSGNSGGPLANAAGQVVGINTAVARGGLQSAANNIGFAISVSELLPEIEALREAAEGTAIEQGFLGVGIEPRTDGGRGAVVTDVDPGSPAEDAGIEVGDIVVAIDGTPLTGATDLAATIRDLDPGTVVVLTVVRDGVAVEITATLAKRVD